MCKMVSNDRKIYHKTELNKTKQKKNKRTNRKQQNVTTTKEKQERIIKRISHHTNKSALNNS